MQESHIIRPCNPAVRCCRLSPILFRAQSDNRNASDLRNCRRPVGWSSTFAIAAERRQSAAHTGPMVSHKRGLRAYLPNRSSSSRREPPPDLPEPSDLPPEDLLPPDPPPELPLAELPPPEWSLLEPPESQPPPPEPLCPEPEFDEPPPPPLPLRSSTSSSPR